MGVEPYLVASTLEGVIAQRLVRRLCRHCCAEYQPRRDDLRSDFPKEVSGPIFKPVGCRECDDTGYSGRIGVFELLRNDATIKKMCVENASSGELRLYGLQHGMMTMRQSGWYQVLTGNTSVAEVVRVTRGDVILD